MLAQYRARSGAPGNRQPIPMIATGTGTGAGAGWIGSTDFKCLPLWIWIQHCRSGARAFVVWAPPSGTGLGLGRWALPTLRGTRFEWDVSWPHAVLGLGALQGDQ